MINDALVQGKANGSVQQAFDYAFAAIHQRYPGREPFEIGDTTDRFDLRGSVTGKPAAGSTAAASAGSPAPSPSTKSPPSPSPRPGPPPSTTSTTAEGC